VHGCPWQGHVTLWQSAIDRLAPFAPSQIPAINAAGFAALGILVALIGLLRFAGGSGNVFQWGPSGARGIVLSPRRVRGS
jgi:hypothetical protein